MTRDIRHYAASEPVERWMKERNVTERDVISWARGANLFRYVQRKLRALLAREAA